MGLGEGGAPTTITGQRDDGVVCSIFLTGIDWTRDKPGQRRDFIRWLCAKEGLTSYAYTGLFGREDDGRDIVIFAVDGVDRIEIIAPAHMRDDGKAMLADDPKGYGFSADAPPQSSYFGLQKTDAGDTRHADDEFFCQALGRAQREGVLARPLCAYRRDARRQCRF